ncbi:MAG: ferrochelatase [Campylobacterales bacterium]|nr:ferrochelatase [Campylobacterales bacterium]
MKKAIILLNMGGPNNLDEVKLFLKNMFNDKYIIDAPQPVRSIIAFMITSLRTKHAKANYKLIGGKSPIIEYTKTIVKDLSQKVDADVFFAMRYTPPFIDEVLEKVQEYDEICAIPMYPQYSSTTTQSSIEQMYEKAKKLNIVHKIGYIKHYYNDKNYNQAIVEKIKEALNGEDASEFELVFSAHGLTKKIIDKGDLYQKHIRYNLFFARKELLLQGIKFHNTHLAYQSRVGPMEWIKPYLEDKLKTLKRKKVIIYPLAFTVDNSETEFELEIEYREVASELGFEAYRVAKAPNNHPFFIESLKNLYESRSWIENAR